MCVYIYIHVGRRSLQLYISILYYTRSRHDSSRSIRTIFCSLVQLQTVRGTAHFQDRPTTKKILTVVIYFFHIATTLSKFPVPTLYLAATQAQLGSPLANARLSFNLGPTWVQHGAAWLQGGPLRWQLRTKLSSTWAQHNGHGQRGQPNTKSLGR